MSRVTSPRAEAHAKSEPRQVPRGWYILGCFGVSAVMWAGIFRAGSAIF